MADLSSVHRYAAAGGLFALASSQSQIQQLTAFELARNTGLDDRQSGNTLFDEDTTSWSAPDFGLLRHVFRFLQVDEKAWVGHKITSLSPDEKHQIGAYLRLLSEEESNASSSNGVQRTMENAEIADAFEDARHGGISRCY